MLSKAWVKEIECRGVQQKGQAVDIARLLGAKCAGRKLERARLHLVVGRAECL